MRTKFNVEYPIAKTINEAIEWMKKGEEVWQEISDDFPDCTGFDDIDCLMENFPEDDFEGGYDADIQSYYLHLCPTDRDKDYAEPFRVGEFVWATDFMCIAEALFLCAGERRKISDINGNKLRFEDVDGQWDIDKFCRCVLPVDEEQVYIQFDLEETSFFGACESQTVYKSLEFLKFECGLNILWSDEYDDFQEELEDRGIADDYAGSDWDIEGVEMKTGALRYGVVSSEIRTEYS